MKIDRNDSISYEYGHFRYTGNITLDLSKAEFLPKRGTTV